MLKHMTNVVIQRKKPMFCFRFSMVYELCELQRYSPPVIWSGQAWFVSSRVDHFSIAVQKDLFTNSADPDETARNEPSHQDLHCLPS